MHPWVWGRMRLYGVQGTQSVRADDEPETRPIIGEEGSTLRLTTTERRLKPRTSPESQPRLGFTGASKNSARGPDSPCGRPYQATAGRPPLPGAGILRTVRPPRGPGLQASPHPVCRVISHSRTPILGTSDRRLEAHTGPSLYGNVAA
jgi:hypothetical protein